MKAAVYTLGCKVNQYESEEMTELLKRNGYLVVNPEEKADVYIVNSCTVTSESNRKTRQAVRRLKSQNPEAVVVLTGCIPQAFPEEAKTFLQADIILGNKNNWKLISSINKYFSDHKNICDITQHENDEKYEGVVISGFTGHTRAFVKIQDGCNRFCSYCAIPLARGRSRSKPLADIKNELITLSKNGFKEIVFVGINLSSFGSDINCKLSDAVKIANDTDGIERVRLGSLEPDHITDDIISELSKCVKFCPQFHISLQSGSDTVLKRMNRHYNTAEYYELTKKLRDSFDDTSITTDIITGFPGETEDEFRETIEFAKKIRFEKVHVFPYSKRDGTRAAQMPCHIDNQTKSKRASVLCRICENIRAESFESIKGKTFSVLFEAPKNGMQCGYTKNYTPVRVDANEELTGFIYNVMVTDSTDDYCIGTLLQNKR